MASKSETTISDRKRAANRANAQRSTGPRTAAGKARVARNAVRHGFNVPVMADPALAAQHAGLAAALAGPDPDRATLDAARGLAEVELELSRLRAARLAQLATAFTDQEEPVWTGKPRTINMRRRPDPLSVLMRQLRNPNIQIESKIYITTVPKIVRLRLRVERLGAALAIVDRYERRVRARRDKAIAALDRAQLARQSHGGAGAAPDHAQTINPDHSMGSDQPNAPLERNPT